MINSAHSSNIRNYKNETPSQKRIAEDSPNPDKTEKVATNIFDAIDNGPVKKMAKNSSEDEIYRNKLLDSYKQATEVAAKEIAAKLSVIEALDLFILSYEIKMPDTKIIRTAILSQLNGDNFSETIKKIENDSSALERLHKYIEFIKNPENYKEPIPKISKITNEDIDYRNKLGSEYRYARYQATKKIAEVLVFEELLDLFNLSIKSNLDKDMIFNAILPQLNLENFEKISKKIGEDLLVRQTLCTYTLDEPFFKEIRYQAKPGMLSKNASYALDFLKENGACLEEYNDCIVSLGNPKWSLEVLESLIKLCPNLKKISVLFANDFCADDEGKLVREDQYSDSQVLGSLKNLSKLEFLNLSGTDLDEKTCKAVLGDKIKIENTD